MCCILMVGLIVRRFESWTDSIDSKLGKTEAYENNVGFSDRSDVPIEPRISEQWFLRYPKTKEALAVVRDHLIRFFPAHWEKVYAQWLGSIQDWCISRQIWWGHRTPAGAR